LKFGPSDLAATSLDELRDQAFGAQPGEQVEK
jgi:hypothetical protein